MTIIPMPSRGRTRPTHPSSAEPFDTAFNFAHQQDLARQRLTEQQEPAFIEAKSDAELIADRDVAERIRKLDRTARFRTAQRAYAHDERRRQREIADSEALADAVAAHQRFGSPAARAGRLFRSSQRVSRVLHGVVATGVVWGSFNVQHNLMDGVAVSDPRYWLAFLYEPMITLPLIAIMHVATTAAREGRTVAKRKFLAVEAILLAFSLALNIAPHIAAGDFRSTVEFAIAPIMIAAAVALHSFASSEYAQMVANSPALSPAGPAATAV